MTPGAYANILAVNQQVRDHHADLKVIRRARRERGLEWLPAEQEAIRLMLEASKQITCEDCGEPTTEWDWAGKYQVCPKCLAKETDAAADRSDWLYHQRRD